MQRNVFESESLKLRQIACFSYKLLRNFMDFLESNETVWYHLLRFLSLLPS